MRPIDVSARAAAVGREFPAGFPGREQASSVSRVTQVTLVDCSPWDRFANGMSAAAERADDVLPPDPQRCACQP